MNEKLREKLLPTERFSDRVRSYTLHRPSYPAALLAELSEHIGGFQGARVADVGSGTGILTELLLNAGATVFAVEPNLAMRASAESRLAPRAGFTSVPGTAEATTLPQQSVDLVTCAQAFHWFDPVKTRTEFSRILKVGGHVALIWNTLKKQTALGAAYDQFKSQYGGQSYRDVEMVTNALDQAFTEFFGPAGFARKIFANHQEHDLEGLIGRFFSSSYAPSVQDREGRDSSMRELEVLFARFQVGGKIRFAYDTELFFGP